MITINYGTDWTQTTYEAIAASDICQTLKPEQHVAIKPNLVVACPPRDGATSHPEVVEGIILYLKEFGISRIDIMENSAIGVNTKEAFKVCGYEELKRKYGVNLIDLKDSETARATHHGLEVEFCRAAVETDFLINVPVLKAHSQTRLTCCLKNLKGCIPEREMRRFHTLGLHKPIAVLNTLVKVHFCVIDGICGDLTFEEGGTPNEANRIIAGSDPLLLDSYCAGLIGYDIEEIEYLRLAEQMGVGELYTPSTKITELNADRKPLLNAKAGRLSDRYGQHIVQDAACSTCYAAAVFALHKARGQKPPTLHIGQGFKGKKREGIGIGNCCSGFETYVKGCPPKAVEIRKKLK